MKKELYGKEKIIIEETSEEKLLEYYLVIKETPFKSSNINYVSYGAEINMSDNNSDDVESKLLEDLFFSKEKAVAFMDSLVKGRVTPCELEEIAEDTLKQQLMNL